MKWVAPEKWDVFIKSENTCREAALTAFAIRVATNKDAIASLRSNVEEIQDSDASEQFEIVRFNYEFLSKKTLSAKINVARSALSALEKAEKKYLSHKRRQEKLEAEWREKSAHAESLRIQIDTVLKPGQPSFPPHTFVDRRQKIILDFSKLDANDFPQRSSYFWGLIETHRKSVNQHIRKTGDISLIKPMEEWRQTMLDLEGMIPNFNRSTKFSEESRRRKEQYEEGINVLKNTLCDMGDFALYALMCLYIKLADAGLEEIQ